tara:strand:+ start:260 stop:739 length:480 start_codon:yes stop_codon:yes gene_type:complete
MRNKTHKLLILILFILIFSLFAAYVIEYILGHKACKLCIYQRIPYFISILILINFLIIKKYQKISLLILSVVSFFGFILSFYHFGIEQGFFADSFVCETQNLTKDLTKEDILKQLGNNTVGCKDVTFRVFGLSLATINTIFSLTLFIIFIKLYKNYEKN